VVETQILARQRSEQSKGSEVRAKSALSPGMCCVKALARTMKMIETRPDRTRRHFLIDNQYFIHTGIYMKKFSRPAVLLSLLYILKQSVKRMNPSVQTFSPPAVQSAQSDC
jgi:hypothetical protein